MRQWSPAFYSFVTALLALGGAQSANAQCDGRWLPGGSFPGVAGSVLCSVSWDPDGTGPEERVVVLGGAIAGAGNTRANGIVTWDGTTFGTLGTGMTGDVPSAASGLPDPVVYSLAVLPNGRLVAAGGFSAADGRPAASIAEWDGTRWNALGTGILGYVLAMTVAPNGDLFAGGFFSNGLGQRIASLARWDGVSWSSVEGGPQGFIWALTTMPDGRVIAGGRFNTLDGSGPANLAQWDGATWSDMGNVFAGDVSGLMADSDGNLVAVGQGTTLGSGPASVLRFRANQWEFLGDTELPPFPSPNYAMAALPNGEILMGASFERLDGTKTGPLSLWNGAEWRGIDGVEGAVGTLVALPDGRFAASGAFRWIGPDGLRHHNLAILEHDHTWTLPVEGSGTTDGVGSWFLRRSGIPVVFSLYSAIEGRHVPEGLLELRNGEWTEIAPSLGIIGFGARFLECRNGDLIVAGWLTLNGESHSVVRVDALSGLVTPMRGTFTTPPTTVAELDDGTIVVGGLFTQVDDVAINRVAKWTGAAWTSVGEGFNGRVNSLAVLPGGALIAGGEFTLSGATTALRVAVWTANGWGPLDRGFNGPVTSLRVLGNGALMASGTFSQSGTRSVQRIACWSEFAWQALGGGQPRSIGGVVECPDGSLLTVIGATATGIQTSSHIARWDGTAWSDLPGEFDGVPGILPLLSGELLCVGDFFRVGDVPSAIIARWIKPTADLASAGGVGLPDGQLDNSDFVAFIHRFFSQDLRNDIARSGGVEGGDGSLDNNDFIVFIDWFFGGC